MDDDFWWVHQVQVRTKLGAGGRGPVLADPVPFDCWVEDVVNTVLDEQGNEVTSTATLRGPLDGADLFTPGTPVTLPSGRTAEVIKASPLDSGSLDLGLDHVEVALK